MNLTKHLNQTATLWRTDGTTDIYGKPIYSAPVSIKVRWEGLNELFQSKSGEEKTSRAKVISITDMDVDSWLYLGESNATDPTKVADAWEIQGLSTVPDLRGLQQLVVAFL